MKIGSKLISIAMCFIMLFGTLAVGAGGIADLFEVLSVKSSAAYSVVDKDGNQTAAINMDGSESISNAQLKVPSDTEVAYAAWVIVKAKATGVPEGYYVALYDGETLLEKGSNTEVSYEFPGEFKTTKKITAKIIDDNGDVQKDSDGNDLTATFEVKARSGFFARLIALFMRMLRSYPGLFRFKPVIVEPK